MKKTEDTQKKPTTSFRLWVDTNVIHEFLVDSIDKKIILENMGKEFSKYGHVTLYVYDQILDETISLESHEFEKKYSRDQILEKLEENFYTFHYPGNYREALHKRIEEGLPPLTGFCPCETCEGKGKFSTGIDCKKCGGKGKVELSKKDAILLLMVLDQNGVLVTRDGCLIKIAKIEAERSNKSITVFNPFNGEIWNSLTI